MLEAVVHGYAEGLSQRSQCPGRAGALPRLNLGKVNGIDTGGGGQLGLGHIAMVPIHPDRILPSQEPVRNFDGKGLAPSSFGVIVNLLIAQQGMGVFIRQAFIFPPRNHGEDRLSVGVKNHLGLVHHILLAFVGLTARDDAQQVNNPGGIISLEDNPQVADPETKTGSAGQCCYIHIPSVRVLGQPVQLSSNTLGLLTRHPLQSSYSLPLDHQKVRAIFHTRNIALRFIVVKLCALVHCPEPPAWEGEWVLTVPAFMLKEWLRHQSTGHWDSNDV